MPTFAKLTRPKTHRVLRRERLFAHIEQARERPLVWVSGPPGAGKSTLVASYLDANKGRAAWYHLDPGDDDIGTFFYYLAQSLPAGGKSAPQLPQFGPEHRARRPTRAPLDQVIEQIRALLAANVPDADSASASGALMLHLLSSDLTEAYYGLLRDDRPTCHAKLRSGLQHAREDYGKRTWPRSASAWRTPSDPLRRSSATCAVSTPIR